jgi:hypothetical protein
MKPTIKRTRTDMKSGNLLNSTPKVQYPRASRWLKSHALKEKLENVYNLALIEEVTAHQDFDSYLSMKEDGHILPSSPIFKEWLEDRISETDSRVYACDFQPGQDIKYFRDFFHETKEEKSHNSRGETITLKAYGRSNKIDREVISFEGRFVNGKLASFNDKTGDTWHYSSSKYYNDLSKLKDRDLLENNMETLLLLAENDCLEALAPSSIKSIVEEDLLFFEKLTKKMKEEMSSNMNLFFFSIYSEPFPELPFNGLRLFDINHNVIHKEDSLAMFYYVEDIVDYASEAIRRAYLFSEGFSEKGWKHDLKQYARRFLKDDGLFDSISERIDWIRDRVQSRKEEIALQQKREKAKKNMKRTIGISIIPLIFIAGFFMQRGMKTVPQQAQGNVKGEMDSTLSMTLLDTLPDGTTIFISPGEYVVAAQAGKGISLYMDSRRRKKLRIKATPLSEVRIEKVEKGMGYFRSYTNGDGRKSNAGWIEMRHLELK